ncbi:toxin-antitoxin system YwqK family antitoxin [Flavobacterium defluvii]|uniref:Antitoxin component YwqK of the YwqJK toxin-antitoxin module n=1 Tax=Flavobacterium defluvii TaxID=370979 RepID=A0A1M5HES8_9FLAO|nr:toxin-antitoxin system YwqK family antitoxin [Flavobacterium defluvii]SHG14427.1 Antitoxin component YwqK of the YwqJK toxin-antitoxin module [Flavobacterium defluvii]
MKKILLFLSLILFSKNYSQTDYTFVYNADSIINKGARLHDQKKYDEAIKEYKKISKWDPKYLTAQYEIALTLSAQQKKSELKAFLEDLHKRGKMEENPELFQIYAIFLSNEKEYEASEKIFNEGQKYLGNSSTFLYNLAVLYIRKDEPQKGVEVLKTIITKNPNHAGSHYLLGLTAFDNGKITEGTLALMTYLMLAPTGPYANQAITNLNANYGQNYIAESKVIFSKSGDNFEEIETILRNQLPLKKVYKIKSTIDDNLTRQIQAVAEYAVEHKMEDGFFETTYIPWVKQMVEKNQLEGYSYYSLVSIEDRIGKELNKQKKKINSFIDDYLQKDFWPVFGKRKMDMFGTTEEVIVSIDKHRPYIIGKQVNGLFEGKCKYLNEYENLGSELNFKNGALDGLQRFFNNKGNLIEEKSFSAGKLNGKRTTYYENGNISLIENYKNDVLDGISTSFYLNGGKNCEVNFVNGEKDGTFICLYESGTKKNESQFSKNKLNGKYVHYNELGDILETYNFVNNMIDGNYVEYFDGKTIQSEAFYKNGVIEGTSKIYYPNKTLKKENTFIAGKISKSVEYGENGNKSSETIYNNKEEIESYAYFDNQGNKYFEEKYKGGELKSGVQFTANSPAGTEVNLGKKGFEVKNYNGTPRIIGNFEKGKKNGEWKYFFSSEILRLKESYINGKNNGLTTNYNRNGNVSSICNFENDTISGIYEVYNANKLNQVYHYDKGQQNGPFTTFYSNGAVLSEGFIINNEINSNKTIYSQSGKISSIETYLSGYLTHIETFTDNGDIENSIDYKNKTGNFNLTFNKGVYTKNSSYINGILNGKLTAQDKFKNKIVESEYANGILQNSYKTYSPLGSILVENNYYNGKLNGLNKYYDYVGNLRMTLEYAHGLENGKTIRYYNNKSKLSESNHVNDIDEGNKTYYNQKGEPVLILGYENNVPKFYIKKNKTGELTEKVLIENQTAQISSLYPNGKTAIQFKITKGNFDGKFVINNVDGKADYECNYINNMLDGDRIEYYANGKIYKKEHFVNNEYDGQQQYFKEDGQLWADISLKNDELHGNTLIYNAGKLVQTNKYDSDELVDIIK